MGKGVVAEQHTTAVGRSKDGDDTEQGGLSCSVGTEQSHGLAGIGGERNVAQHLPPAERFGDMFRVEYHWLKLEFEQCHLGG